MREITLDGQRYRHFSSNDYLGLSQHPAVMAAAQGVREAGVGAGASGHVTGYSRHHAQLEQQLASARLPARAAVYLRLCRQPQ